MKKIVTRFAPSPTGKMHLGNARTALFNYLYAKHTNGDFLLRIEDTDKERSTSENIDVIYKSLESMGLKHDGDVTIQSNNLKRHHEVAEEMIRLGMAYRAYDTKEELDKARNFARDNKLSYKYNGIWKDKNHPSYPDDMPYVVRIRNPFPDDHDIVIDDLVQGQVTVKAKEVDDFIILRSDGTPTYLLSVVVDDHDAGVNTIIRGDDHLTNTFRQYLIWNAMGWIIPDYAHVPLIHGEDGKKLSKRNGASSIEDLINMGFGMTDMKGVVNYLGTLGWSPKPDKLSSDILSMDDNSMITYLNKLGWEFTKNPEKSKINEIFSNNIINNCAYVMGNIIGECHDYFESLGGIKKIPEFFSLEEMIEKFDIHDVNKSAAQFDMKKLLHINGYWMANIPLATFADDFKSFIAKEYPDFNISESSLNAIIPSLPIRSKTFVEAYEMIKFLDNSLYLKNIEDKDLSNDIPIVKSIIQDYYKLDLEDRKDNGILKIMKQYAENNNLKLKVVATSVRNVLTGQKISPPLHDVLDALDEKDIELKLNDDVHSTLKM